jgi:ubiquinone/menaquinone biosynthesis C-methylase UbiE
LEEIERNFEDLRNVNYRFGGSVLHYRLLNRIVERAALTSLAVLEVAAGRADVLQYACARLQGSGVRARITLLDRREQHLPRFKNWDSSLPFPELIVGDALDLPIPNQSVDVVSCCLFLHHLQEREIARFLQEAFRVARIAVIINDLERNRLHWLLALAACGSYKSALSRHDGPVSVRRAYTKKELDNMLFTTGRSFETYRAFLFRIGAILWATSSPSQRSPQSRNKLLNSRVPEHSALPAQNMVSDAPCC